MSSHCGPLNPLQKLSQSQQIDRSIHQDHQKQRNAQNNSFKQQNYNPQLEQEFQQQFDPAFQNAFQGTGAQFHRPKVQSFQHQQQQKLGTGSSSWANDFANLSLSGAVSQPRAQSHPQGLDWSSQFIPQPSTQQGSSSMHNQTSFHQLHPNFTTQQMMPQQRFRTEHQEVHHAEQFQKDLESEFSKIEEQFSLPEPSAISTQQELDQNSYTHQNEDFRQAATTISNIMTSSEKFKSSNFLKLMQSISNGSVTLNDEETKLINKEGNDIHEEKLLDSFSSSGNTNVNTGSTTAINTTTGRHLQNSKSGLPDPLDGLDASDLTSPFDSAFKVGQLHKERYTWDDDDAVQIDSNQTNSRLPDPLKGLNPNDFTSPFDAAKKVAELHHEVYTWEDMLADYRVDDDSF